MIRAIQQGNQPQELIFEDAAEEVNGADGPHSLEIKPAKALPKQQPWMEELKMNQGKKEPNQEPPFAKQLKPVLRKVGGFSSQSSNGSSQESPDAKTERPPVTSRPSNIPSAVIPTSSARTTVNNGHAFNKPVAPQQRTSPLETPQARTVPAIYDRIQPVNDQERPIDEDIVHLRQRVATLESTVSTLQKELLQMKKLLERSIAGQPVVHL